MKTTPPSPQTETDEKASPVQPGKSPVKTILIVAGVIAVFYMVVKFTFLGEYFTLKSLKDTMQHLGWYGVIIFLLLNCLAVLMHIPGMVFIFAAVLVYDIEAGIAIAYCGALLSGIISFIFYRTIGGMSLQHLEKPFIKKMLSRIDSRPVLTTVIIRILVGVAPPVNSGLALTNISFRNFLLGSILGLITPVLILSFLAYYFEEYAVKWLS